MKIEDAEDEVISRAQLQAFPEEYMALLTVNEIPEKISMSKLFPQLDDQGVLRCGGRLQLGFSLYCQEVSG